MIGAGVASPHPVGKKSQFWALKECPCATVGPLKDFSFLAAIQKVHPREYTPEYGRAMMKLGALVRQLLLP
jgi:hypothetical protein